MAPTLIGAAEADPSIRFAFSDADVGNVSLAVGVADTGARMRLASAVGSRAGHLVFMQQVHGGDVAVVGRDQRGRGLEDHADGIAAVDALVTTDEDVVLAVLVADCVPVLLADPGRAVAAAHAGRGGVATGVVGATVATLAPDDPGRVEAVIGPAIGGCCYEVERELAEAIADEVPAARATTTWGTPSLDLPAAAAAQLRAAGVERITRTGGCTRCTPSRWFSHRRAPGRGRQAGVVVRAPDGSAPGRRHA
ncbi:MAG: polyphenol oxidase family protein [Actinobacteria bacterium]|nr:polyphenol oxidase family protein [Actinomycetota bacterium]